MTVQRDVVVKQLADLEFQGNEEGLIPGFNVLVNLLPVAFWNTFTERIIEAAPPERLKEVEDALVDCALVCGYNTGYGIITSEEFKSVVDPMVTDGAKDILRGAYAVFTAWGWANGSPGLRRLAPRAPWMRCVTSRAYGVEPRPPAGVESMPTIAGPTTD